LTAFVSLVNHLNGMLYGAVPDGVAVGEPREWPLVGLGGCALVLIVLGLALPGPVAALIDRSIASLLP
jgi:hypothetical protein